MYAKYVSMPTCTRQQVVSDMALLLSGSPVSALSASCDKVNTVLVSTVAPGWTLVDNNTGAVSLGYVLSAPDANGLTTKYVQLMCGATTSNANPVFITLYAYEHWNPVTHVGTNPTASLPVITNSFSPTQANTFFIFATPRSLFITTSAGIATNVSGAGAFEFTREAQYLINSSYPCFAVCGAHLLTGRTPAANASPIEIPRFDIPRVKNIFSNGDITGITSQGTVGSISNKTISGATVGFGYTSFTGRVTTTRALDAGESPYFELRHLWAMQSPSVTAAEGTSLLGEFYDVFETSYVSGYKSLDTITVNGSKYMYFKLDPGAFVLKME